MKIFIPILFIIISSCGIPKETLTRFNKPITDTAHFETEYCTSLPSLKYEDWDKHYIIFDKFKTREISRTQLGLSYMKDGVNIFWCFPSANPYVQLDTATMISDNNKLIGDWKVICNRRIAFEDSITYADKEIYRSEKKLYFDDDNDYFASFTGHRIKLYKKNIHTNKITFISSRNYCIVNKRFIMLYGISKVAAAINFIGIDKEGRLILDSFYQEERTLKTKYIVFHATLSQSIFKKID